jgi:periplasmic protein TonB
VVFRLDSDERALPPPPPPPPPPPLPPGIPPPAALGEPSRPRPPQKVHHVNPVYPEEAKAAGITGVVIMEATIDADGQVTDVRVLRGPEALRRAAVEAVRQWRFEPPAVHPMQLTMTVNFTLAPDRGSR